LRQATPGERALASGLGAASINPSGAATTIDTTASHLLDVTVTWATANAANTITSKNTVMVALN
jgi:hypothetical protein